jgi:hypothetical protein
MQQCLGAYLAGWAVWHALLPLLAAAMLPLLPRLLLGMLAMQSGLHIMLQQQQHSCQQQQQQPV